MPLNAERRKQKGPTERPATWPLKEGKQPPFPTGDATASIHGPLNSRSAIRRGFPVASDDHRPPLRDVR